MDVNPTLLYSHIKEQRLSIHFGLFTEESQAIASIKICSMVLGWNSVIRNRSNAVVYFFFRLICIYGLHFNRRQKQKSDQIKQKIKSPVCFTLHFTLVYASCRKVLIHRENGKLDFVQDTTIFSCKINGDFVPALIGKKCRLICSVTVELLVNFHICVNLPHEGTCSHVTHRS